jgi:hypothetical protein
VWIRSGERRSTRRVDLDGPITGEQDRRNREAMRGGWAVGAGGRTQEVGALWLDGTQDHVLVDGTRVYVANGRQGLVVADLSNPARPRKLGELECEVSGGPCPPLRDL